MLFIKKNNQLTFFYKQYSRKPNGYEHNYLTFQYKLELLSSFLCCCFRWVSIRIHFSPMNIDKNGHSSELFAKSGLFSSHLCFFYHLDNFTNKVIKIHKWDKKKTSADTSRHIMNDHYFVQMFEMNESSYSMVHLGSTWNRHFVSLRFLWILNRS